MSEIHKDDPHSNAPAGALDPDSIPNGTVIHHWRTVGIVSQQGLMAEIYEVEHTSRRETAALKLLRPEFASSDLAIQRSYLEAVAGARIQHPNLNTILDAGAYAGRPFLVTPLLTGLNLRGWLDTVDRLSIPDALFIALEVTEAIAALHREARVIHRDVKPENIFLTSEGCVKLLDLGVAKFLETSDARLRTASGEYAGTLSYMAPEQLESRPSFASDLYSVGLVLHEMIAGCHPHVDANGQWPPTTAILERLIHYQVPPSLTELVPDCPDSLASLVTRCLARWPADRPPSAEALLHLLKQERERWKQAHPSATIDGVFFRTRQSTAAPHPPHQDAQGAAAASTGSPKVILQLKTPTLAPTNPTRGTLLRRRRRRYLRIALGVVLALAVAVCATALARRSRAPSHPSTQDGQ